MAKKRGRATAAPGKDIAIAPLIHGVLEAIGEDPKRDGLLRTPDRVEKALRFLTSGYTQDVKEAVNGAIYGVKYDEIAIAPMFEAFIANMLRNGGPKPIEGMMGITGMLRMVLPLFTYGEAETRWLLEEMEGRGEVVRSGEVWSVRG